MKKLFQLGAVLILALHVNAAAQETTTTTDRGDTNASITGRATGVRAQAQQQPTPQATPTRPAGGRGASGRGPTGRRRGGGVRPRARRR